ncbi:hypothetical protein BFR69_01375 [Acinetobacter pittii]|nr:hypothetical protein C6N19_14245 [Acinetobacter pittii]KRI16467.1 hypothetical protein APC96_07020 [Acinetobacter pittii]OCY25794.1 hypothetical protein BFR64_03785 [Acinetobacter pittii]OCY35440.1 hypothetical protein BFR74_00510 [Acinetobacter pittii]OCZ33732.1 hypothetical protein BFR69_01375 [Acinetobacter pittii]
MNVQSQLLFIGSSAKTLKLWWQNERGLTDWLREPSTHKGVPLPSYRYKKGDEWVYIKKTCFFNVLKDQPVKAGWQCGQHAKNSIQHSYSQAHKTKFALK